jgi:cell division protein FtsQ
MTTRARPRPKRPARPKRKPAPRKAIDPRIRDRRVAVKRAEGRRRLRWLIALVLLGCLAGAAWLLIHSELLDVEHVRITGAQHATADELSRAADVHRGDPLLFVDVGAIEAEVERVPWVDRARVDRRFSGDVDIHVTERRPVAWVRTAPDRVALVDGRGRVLADAAEPPGDLPELGGLATVPRPGRDIAPVGAAGVIEKLPAELQLRTARVVAQGGGITLVLRAGPEIRLGTSDHVAAKARVALAVLGATAGAPPAYIDVRVPAAPVTG